jgi:hypothetical protein
MRDEKVRIQGTSAAWGFVPKVMINGFSMQEIEDAWKG